MDFFEDLLRCAPTERGLRLTFRCRGADRTIGLSWEATGRIFRALEVPTEKGIPAERLTLTVLGHQVVQAHEAKGLLLRTKEWGIVVFSLPQEILPKLITDLVHLVSSRTPVQQQPEQAPMNEIEAKRIAAKQKLGQQWTSTIDSALNTGRQGA